MKHGKKIFVFVCFMVVALITSCSGKDDAQDAAVETETIYAVSVFETQKDRIENYLEFGGDVVATTNVDVYPESQGKLVEVKVSVGDYVQKDQVIALVDASRPGMSYALGHIKSPISGTITQLNMTVGSMVAPQLTVAKVSTLDNLQISMNVPERYVSKIRLGQKASLNFDAYPGKTFSATVREISPVLDTTSRTMSVKLSLDSRNTGVKIGMFARVKLITEVIPNAVVVPASVVVSRFGEQFVFVVEPVSTLTAGEGSTGDENLSASAEVKYAVRKQLVVQGVRVDEKVEITNGLHEGDIVVARGQTLLEDGSRVNVVSRLEGFRQTMNDAIDARATAGADAKVAATAGSGDR